MPDSIDRRRFVALAAAAAAAAVAPARAQDGVRGEVGGTSRFAKVIPAEQVEQAAGQQYQQLLQGANQKGQLAPASDPQAVRLRAIAARIVPFAPSWNRRAAEWKWEVHLIISDQLNAFCMPGGKIAFYSGLLAQLQLTDDEVATVMGHEMAHALREHAREQMGKKLATRAGANLLSAVLGLGNVGNTLLDMGTQVAALKFSRSDESEADIVGMDLAARAGYDPRAGVALWNKMLQASKGAPAEFLSTHPSGTTRIADIEARLPKVLPLYEAAAKPERRFGPPPLPPARKAG